MPEPRLSHPPRQLSRFMCEELLYDYVEDRLDSERHTAVTQTLQAQPDLQREYKGLKLAQEYCSQVSKIRIASTQIENLKAVKSLFSLTLERLRYRSWPDVLQWTAQALVISSLVAAAALIIPWSRIERHFTQPKPIMSAGKPVPAAPIVPLTSAPKKPSAKAKSEVVKVKSEVAKTATIKTITTPPIAPPLKGILYRMWMSVPHANKIGAKIRKKIIALGGYKAGKVKLGWHRKAPRGDYFHFILPQKNYEIIINDLKQYGPLAISKTANVRVMPPGKVRIILMVQNLTPPKAKNNGRQQNNNKK